MSAHSASFGDRRWGSLSCSGKDYLYLALPSVWLLGISTLTSQNTIIKSKDNRQREGGCGRAQPHSFLCLRPNHQPKPRSIHQKSNFCWFMNEPSLQGTLGKSFMKWSRILPLAILILFPGWVGEKKIVSYLLFFSYENHTYKWIFLSQVASLQCNACLSTWLAPVNQGRQGFTEIYRWQPEGALNQWN